MGRPDRALVADAGLTVVLGVAFVASTAGSTGARELDGLGWVLIAANVLPLLALRRAPMLVVACFSVAYPAWASLEYPTHLLQSLPTLAAMGAAGAAPRPLWWRALALLCPAEMLAAAASGVWDVDVLEIGYVAILFVSGWVLGVVLSARRRYTRELEEKTAALEVARQELARRAVLEERTRIARDLHDILAHAMSVITVQAGVGAHLLERDPEQAKGALRVIEETGRGALGEMRRLLGALRADDLPTEPQPGLASLDRLAAQTTAAGVPVELQVEGPARPLPAGLEVSAYRIAQEALTNTIKHAPRGPGPPHRPVPAPHRRAGGGRHRRRHRGRRRRWRPRAAGDARAGRPLRGRARGRAHLQRVPGPWPPSLPTSHDRAVPTGPGAGGRRPGAGPGRVRGPAGLRRRHLGGRPGRGRGRGGRPGPPDLAPRGADGHPHAGHGRDRRHPRAAGPARPARGRDPHHLRHRRVRLPGVPGRRVRVHGQGHPARRAAPGRPPDRRRRHRHLAADGQAPGRDLAASQPEPRPTPDALQDLTERELEVLRLLARGHSNREIARELYISELTAKTHVSRILTKLDLLSRVHAVVFAYETGLVTPGSTT